jgi:hypothetical protein
MGQTKPTNNKTAAVLLTPANTSTQEHPSRDGPTQQGQGCCPEVEQEEGEVPAEDLNLSSGGDKPEGYDPLPDIGRQGKPKGQETGARAPLGIGGCGGRRTG